MSAILTVTDRERDLAERLRVTELRLREVSTACATAEQQRDELAAQVEAMLHVANEWADAACNGRTWLRNVADGISSTNEAITAAESDIKHARDVGASARTQQTAATILRQRDARVIRQFAAVLLQSRPPLVLPFAESYAKELERKNG